MLMAEIAAPMIARLPSAAATRRDFTGDTRCSSCAG
jgi:hypothetical protein